MNKSKIDRINELYRKSKTSAGLTDEEKQEQSRLRAEYVKSIRDSFKATLDDIEIVD